MSRERGTRPPDSEQGVPVDLADDGVLWLINTSVFHPRGFALAVIRDQAGAIRDIRLLGDGSEPWQFAPHSNPRTVDECFAAVEALFARARERSPEAPVVLHAWAPPSPNRRVGEHYPLCGARYPDDLMTIPAQVTCPDCLTLLNAKPEDTV